MKIVVAVVVNVVVVVVVGVEAIPGATPRTTLAAEGCQKNPPPPEQPKGGPKEPKWAQNHCQPLGVGVVVVVVGLDVRCWCWCWCCWC